MRATVHLCHKCHPTNEKKKTKLNIAHGSTFVDISSVRPNCLWITEKQMLKAPTCRTENIKGTSGTLWHSFFFCHHSSKVILRRCSQRRAVCQIASFIFIFIYESQTEPPHKRPISLQRDRKKKSTTRTKWLREAWYVCPVSRITQRFLIFHSICFSFVKYSILSVFSIFAACTVWLCGIVDAFNMLFYGYCFEIPIKRSHMTHCGARDATSTTVI